MTSPRLSIIVPIYNSEKTLPACLDSLRRQTFKDLEIILVDDGSSDGSLAIAREFALSFDRLCTVLSQGNKGPSAARNMGLEVAKGDFVAFVDSDDTIDESMYEKMMASADRYNSDIVSCGRKMLAASTGAILKERAPGYEMLQGPISYCPDITRRVGPLMCDKIFRRKVIESNGIRFDEDIWYAEDFLFGTRVKLHVNRVSAVRECLYHYTRGSDDSITTSSAYVMDTLEASRRVVNLYKEAGLLDAVNDQLLYVLVGYYLRRCASDYIYSNEWSLYRCDYRRLLRSNFGFRWILVTLKRCYRDHGIRGGLALAARALV